MALVEEWLSVFSSHLSSGHPPPSHVLSRLEAHLSSCVYFVGNRVTAADCVLYAALHSCVAKLDAGDRTKYPNIVRWLDHIRV